MLQEIATPIRVCSACGIPKPLTEFWKNKTHRGGYDNKCKICKTAGKNHQHIYATKTVKASLRETNVPRFKNIRLEYRANPSTPMLPAGWYVVIEGGAGVPASVAEVNLWWLVQELRANLRKMEKE